MDKYFRTEFSESIFNYKYKHEGANTWDELSKTLVEDVCREYLDKSIKDELSKMHTNMEFIAGGRYLYYAGRAFKAFNNCYLLRSLDDSREDWANLSWKAESCLMTGGGIGNDYSVYRPEDTILSRTGGKASGPISKMKMINEIGREVMQGGSRRSAIYASLNWKHADAGKFLVCKDWHSMTVSGAYDELGNPATVAYLKQKDFNYPAPLDMTNISLNYDNEFLEEIYGLSFDILVQIYKDGGKQAIFSLPIVKLPQVFLDNCKQALKTGEPGFSFNFFEKVNETLRNACQPANATILTPEGISTIGSIETGDVIWTGRQWSKVINKWSTGIKSVYKYNTSTGYFLGTDNHRIVENGVKLEVKDAQSIDWCVGDGNLLTTDFCIQSVMDGLIVGDGSVHKASNNLVYLLTEDKDYDYFTDDVCSLLTKARPGLQKGAWEIKTTIHHSELPKTYERVVPDRFFFGNEVVKRSFLRGLFSANGSVNGNRVCLKQSSRKLIEQVREMLSSLGIHSYITTNKSKDIKFSNGTYRCKESYDINITSGRSLFAKYIGFIQGYKNEKTIEGNKPKYLTSDIKSIEYIGEEEVFEITVEAEEHTYWTGGVLVSNCTEVTSEDDSDVCNLASINMANIDTIERFAEVVYQSSKFLLCGTMVADLPYDKVYQTREKNRRLGLGLMGVHEWLLKRGYRYEVVDELKQWLEVYVTESERGANELADSLGINRPVAYRAIAPTGTIGIMAGTTTGIEPLFAVAYKRRYLKGQKEWHYQYVIDGTAKLLIDKYDLDPRNIESAVDLAQDPERRIKFQADIQDYVDMSISSTINLPEWGSEVNNESKVEDFANMLAKYAVRLRGFTCYPDGSRGGQPLTSVSYEEAKQFEGQEFKEVFTDICDLTGGGTCGM
jgi:ribonucleotide reductase alpha subunit